MDKRKGVVIAIALLLLFGTGTFVFANPSEEEEVTEGAGNRPSVQKSDNDSNGITTTPPTQTDEGVEDTNNNEELGTNLGENVVNGTNNRPSGNRGNSVSGSSTNNTGGNSNSANSDNGSSIDNNTNNNNNSGSSNNPTGGNNSSGNITDDSGNSGNSGSTDNSGNNGGTGNEGGNESGDNNTGGDSSDNKPDPDEENKPNEDLEAIKDAQNKLDEIIDDLTQENIDDAKDLIDKIEDETKKQELLDELKILQELLDLTNLVSELTNKINTATKKEDIDNARAMSNENDINNRLQSLESSLTNDDIKKKLEDLKVEMSKNNIVLNDVEGPHVLGINNSDVARSVNIYYGMDEDINNITAYIGTKPITLEDINNIKTEGTYVIDFYDKAFNKTTLTFTIDTTLPIISGIKENFNSEDLNSGIKITINDASDTTIYIEKDGVITEIVGKEFVLDNSYEDGVYKIWAIDKAGNSSLEFNFEIDKEKPIISGIENKTYNLNDLLNGVRINVNENDSTIYLEKDGVVTTIDSNSVLLDTSYESGNYKVWVVDKALNKSLELEFSIDKDLPEYKNLGIVNLSRINTDKNIKEASLGDEIAVFVTFDEFLSVHPVIKVNDIVLDVTLENVRDGLYVYKGKYVVDETTKLGEVVISVTSYQDNALNTGRDLTNSDINHEYSGVTVVKAVDPDDGDDNKEELGDAFEFVKGKYFHDEKMVIGYENYAGMTIEDVSNHTLIGVTDTNPYTTTEKVYETNNLNAGTYVFTVYDVDGNVIVSAKMYFDNVNPVISGTGVQNGEGHKLISGETYEKLDLNITDNALSFVTIYKDDVEIETKNFGNLGNRSFAKSFTENGTYRVVVQDKAGNEVSTEFVIERCESLLSRMMSIIGVRI